MRVKVLQSDQRFVIACLARQMDLNSTSKVA